MIPGRWSRLPLVAGSIRLKLLLLVLICSLHFAYAQDVKVSGGFLSDSIKIGEQTAFYLSVRYPSNLNILFPDSAADFAPFEYQKRKYFPTRTKNGISKDSTLYYLTTFEIDKVQGLSLTAYVLNERDCTSYASNTDSLQLIELVAQIPDSIAIQKLPLMENTRYEPVSLEFNYLIALAALGIVVILVLLAWIFFGKRIQRYFKTRRLLKKHRAFTVAYGQSIDQIQKTFNPVSAEGALSLWKKYLEQLEARPYTKLTSREMLALLNDEPLAVNLRNIDKAIYGHNTSVVDSLQHLRAVADQRFNQKLQKLKHGK
jgi:hypothetical protein